MTTTTTRPERLLVICDAFGATQNISFRQPLAEDVAAGRMMLEFRAHDAAWSDPAACEVVWAEVQPDVLILSRYTSGLAGSFLRLARQNRVPVIFHIDDDLLGVPESLGAAKFEFYNQPERLAALRSAMNASDLVYASTPILRDTLKTRGIEAPVLAGDIYCSVDANLAFKPLPATGPVIGYMATGGHGADLEMVIPAIRRLMTTIPDLRFETFGSIGAKNDLADFGARVGHHKGVPDYDRFLAKLAELGWWIGIAPLEATPFNACKADTKWVEYTFCGTITVATDLPVYQRACADGAGALAATEQDWYEHLRRLLREQSQRQSQLEAARHRLAATYSRAALRAQLLGVLAEADRYRGLGRPTQDVSE